jgi:hypothetical protein
MIRRKGKSVSLNINENWKISYGAFDIKNPITLYIKLQTYLTPSDENIDCNPVFDSIDNYQIPNDGIFDSKYIQKTTFASAKVKKNKQSCLVITLTVKQKNEVIPFNTIQPHIITFIDDFISTATSGWNFSFYPKRKK